MLKKINSKIFTEINFKNIYTRQIYIYKSQQILDKNVYESGSYFTKKSEWDDDTIFLYTNVLNSIQNFYLNNPDKFRSMYESYMINTKQKEHSIKNFNTLASNFDLNLLAINKIKIAHLKNKIIKNYVVVDGVHRLVIYAFKYDDKKINKMYLDFV